MPPPIVRNPICATFIRSFRRWRYSSEKYVFFLKHRFHQIESTIDRHNLHRHSFPFSFSDKRRRQISCNISTTRWLLEFFLNFKVKEKKGNQRISIRKNFSKIPGEGSSPIVSSSNSSFFEYFHLHLNPRQNSKIERFRKKKKKKKKIVDKTSRPWTRGTSAILKSGRQRRVGGPWTDPRQGNIQHLSKGSRVALWNRVIWPLAVLQISSSSASRSFHVFATHPSHRAS